MPTSSPHVAQDCGWIQALRESEMPKMFNEGHIYHHLVVSLQGTSDGSDLDECDNIELYSNTSKTFMRGEQFFRSGHATWMREHYL